MKASGLFFKSWKSGKSSFLLSGVGVLIATLTLNGCSSSPVSKKRTSQKPAITGISNPSAVHSESASGQETLAYKDIEAHFNKNEFEASESKIAAFIKHFPRSTLRPSVENIYGLLLLRNKKAPLAITHFQKAISLNPNSLAFNQYIKYNLATAQLEANLYDDAQTTASQINLDSVDKSNRIKVYYLLASIADKKALPLDSARELLLAGKSFGDPDFGENKKSFYKLLDQSLQSIQEIPALEALYREFESSVLSDALMYRLGSQEISIGNTGNGEEHLKTLMARFPQSSYYSQANDLINRSQAKGEVDSHTIGVLLPMKGKFAKFGTRSLQGIELALRVFNHAEPDSKLSLVIEDSSDDPEQAIKAMNRLVIKHHVVAIIGPMLTKGVDQISHRAQELGVPLISLSRKAVPSGDFVFQAGMTQQLQTYEIARYAIQKAGLKNFAIIYPSEKYGNEISQTFWDAVESLGGKIVGVESYRPDETDFREPIDKLSGVHYTEARQRELELLAQEREANHIRKRTRKTEQFFNLKPIVDYDAVFIPDEAKVAGQILPTFDYRDINHIKFLGTSSWNSPDFLTRLQSYGETSFFVDAFFPDSTSSQSKKFYEKYKSTFGQEPSSLEALAYDAAMLLVNILEPNSGNISRADLRDRLKKVHDFPGITGKITYKDGQFFRDLRVLTVKNNKFIEVPESIVTR